MNVGCTCCGAAVCLKRLVQGHGRVAVLRCCHRHVVGFQLGMDPHVSNCTLYSSSLAPLRPMRVVLCRYPPTLSAAVRLEQVSGDNAYCLTSVTGQVFAVQYPYTASAVAAPAPGPVVRSMPDHHALH